MIAEIEIGYSARDVVNKWERPKWEAMRENLMCLKLPVWQEDKERPTWYHYGEHTLADLDTDGIELGREGIEFTIRKFKNTYKVANPNTHHHLHIAIPNIGLLVIDEVRVEEDSCTDQLQRRLDEGWRIIAVCPPNGTRRPDYVLGRSKHKD